MRYKTNVEHRLNSTRSVFFSCKAPTIEPTFNLPTSSETEKLDHAEFTIETAKIANYRTDCDSVLWSARSD